jgi:hypothetical protein
MLNKPAPNIQTAAGNGTAAGVGAAKVKPVVDKDHTLGDKVAVTPVPEVTNI